MLKVQIFSFNKNLKGKANKRELARKKKESYENKSFVLVCVFYIN